MKKNKILAFTLAEVLVVIGVIGIVAALTLPNLSADTQERETVAKYKKAKMVINEAIGRAVAKYGPMYKWELNGGDDIVTNRLAESLSVANRTGGKIILQDGSSFMVTGNTVYYDIDGPKKGENKNCVDSFVFELSNKGVVRSFNVTNTSKPPSYSVVYCGAWIDRFDNADFLKTSDGKTCVKSKKVLDWNTNTSCN